MLHYRRLPLNGLRNIRDLGGYPASGGVTGYGVFIRSEVPRTLTKSDAEFLRGYGVTLNIDLRGSYELEKIHDALADEAWLEYMHLPMFDSSLDKKTSGARRLKDMESLSWGDRYIIMAENAKDWAKRVITALAEAEGAALFHCTTGKDRTGFISALVLGICGVSREDITADYCVSQIYLEHIYKDIGGYFDGGDKMDTNDPFFSTAPENMLALLQHFSEKYGGVGEYALSCGISAEQMSAIRVKLIEAQKPLKV